MLEHVPAWLGHLLRNVRAGHADLVIAAPGIVGQEARLELSSTAFADGARLPERFTADREGSSPPLVWSEPPQGAAAFALIVEDPDAPAPHPLVHGIVWDIDPAARRLGEGAFSHEGDAGLRLGRNSFFSRGWLPPDPPTGHGTHDYVFQLFALRSAPDLGERPGRSELVAALAGNVVAAGVLIGTYSRGEPAATAGREDVQGLPATA